MAKIAIYIPYAVRSSFYKMDKRKPSVQDQNEPIQYKVNGINKKFG